MLNLEKLGVLDWGDCLAIRQKGNCTLAKIRENLKLRNFNNFSQLKIINKSNSVGVATECNCLVV